MVVLHCFPYCGGISHRKTSQELPSSYVEEEEPDIRGKPLELSYISEPTAEEVDEFDFTCHALITCTGTKRFDVRILQGKLLHYKYEQLSLYTYIIRECIACMNRRILLKSTSCNGVAKVLL